jgi:hypothetical protein
VKTKTLFTVGWLLWLAAFLALEGSALFNHISGDTLSENTWAWFHVFDPHPGLLLGTLRVLLGLFLLWLAFHLTFGWFTPTRPLPRIGALMSTSTQTRHPWRATARTVLAAGLALLPLLPTIAATAHVDTVPVVATVLVVAGAITRMLAHPAVDGWLRRFAPWLASSPAA